MTYLPDAEMEQASPRLVNATRATLAGGGEAKELPEVKLKTYIDL